MKKMSVPELFVMQLCIVLCIVNDTLRVYDGLTSVLPCLLMLIIAVVMTVVTFIVHKPFPCLILSVMTLTAYNAVWLIFGDGFSWAVPVAALESGYALGSILPAVMGAITSALLVLLSSILSFDIPFRTAADISVGLLVMSAVLFIVNRETKRETASERVRNNFLSQQNSELLAASSIDKLTGLYNRRAYDKKIYEYVQNADRLHSNFSLILVDVDHFKMVNDNFGHQTGDSVLSQVAGILRRSVRKCDSACRYGGEEFMIILQTDISQAAERADAIRTAVEESVFSCGKVTISLGVAEYRIGEEPETLAKRADDCLYYAKEHGRNMVCTENMI